TLARFSSSSVSTTYSPGSYSYPRMTRSQGTSRPVFLLYRLYPTGEKSARSRSVKLSSVASSAGRRLTGISTRPKLKLPFQNARAIDRPLRLGSYNQSMAHARDTREKVLHGVRDFAVSTVRAAQLQPFDAQ